MSRSSCYVAGRAGCMIVELQDYRSAKNRREVLTTPETSRVVLRPNAETLWADICLLSQKAGNSWTDHDALGMEARLLVCLRIARPYLCVLTSLCRIADYFASPVSATRRSPDQGSESYSKGHLSADTIAIETESCCYERGGRRV